MKPMMVKIPLALLLGGLLSAPVAAQETEEAVPIVRISQTQAGEILPDLPEGANVIIFRAYAEPTVWTSSIKVDGKKLGAIGNKKWTATTLDPGTYDVKIGWSFLSGQKGGKYKLTVEEGKVHILEIVGQSRYAGGYGAGMAFQMGSGIGEIIGERAITRVTACCEFKPPAN